MSSWRQRLRQLVSGLQIGGRQSPAEGPEDADRPTEDTRSRPAEEESQRIVEEAIQRREEAEGEWAKSWEPEKSND